MSSDDVGRQAVDQYIAAADPAVRDRLVQVRNLVRTLAPGASEKISYGMPTFFLAGNLVHYALFDHHLGFYPVPTGIAAFQADLAPFKQGKGSVQFPHDQPLPLDLIARIVEFRVRENLDKAAAKGAGEKKAKKA